MSDQLPVKQNLDDLPISNVTDEELAKLAKRNYLPYVKLLVSSSAELEDPSKGFRAGEWIFCRSKDSVVSLTNSFEALVVGARPRACRKTATGIFSFYDRNEDEYKKVVKESEVRGTMGVWHGTEFLIWIRSLGEFATYHASSATAQGRSANLIAMLQAWKKSRDAIKDAKEQGVAEADLPKQKLPQATFKSALITYQSINKKQHGPVFDPATTPFSSYPSVEEIREQSMKFFDPPKKNVETAENNATEEGRG